MAKHNNAMHNGNDNAPLSYRAKILTSCAIWYCTFTLGLGISFLGSSLLELSIKFGTDVSTVSKVFTVLTASFLVGAITSGVLFNHVNRQLASVVLLAGMGIGTILFPLVPSLVLFFCVAGLVGFSGAGYDTAQIVWVIELWEAHAAPYIQVQHFIFAVGTFVSPLLVKPFLSDNKNEITPVVDLKLLNETVIDDLTNRTAYSTMGEDEFNHDNATGSPSVLYIPFLIGGLFSIAGGIILLVMYWIKPYVKPAKINSSSTNEENGQRRSSTGGLAKACNFKKILLVFLSAFMLGAYTGMEMCSIQFLPTFTHFVSLGLTSKHGASILSGLTGAFTIGRGVGIFVVLKVLPEILLVGNITLIILGNSILYFFANDSLIALWGGSICLGLGFSTVFPCFYGYIEKHLRISNFVGACMIVGGGAVSSLFPLIIGGWIQTNPFVLMYTNYFSITVCIISFTSIYMITKRDEAKDFGRIRRNGKVEEAGKNDDHDYSTDTEVNLKVVRP